MNDEHALSKTKAESEFDPNESEKPLDFGFAKNVGIRQDLDTDSNSVTSYTAENESDDD